MNPFSPPERRSNRLARSCAVLFTVLVLLAVPASGRGQEVDLEAIDAWIADLMGDWPTPGLAVGIVYRDSLVFARGYGVR
jgi:CubicO group peptidase (beta-lactamase class C family)